MSLQNEMEELSDNAFASEQDVPESICFGRREFLKGAAGVAGFGLLSMGGLAGLAGCSSPQAETKQET